MTKSRSTQKQDIEKYLFANRTEIRELLRTETADVCQRWLARFAVKVKRQEGVWVFKGYKWHGFSYGIEQCLSGDEALQAYRHTKGRFYLFDEEATYGYLCKTTFPFRPDLSQFRADIYVVAFDYSWTIVFTHEQPQLGPFFAEQDARPNDDSAIATSS